jgi:hypothetical protein
MDMRSVLSESWHESERLSAEINRAVNGLQFPDRVNQRRDHVVQALDDCHSRLSGVSGDVQQTDHAYIEDLVGRYTMHDERALAGSALDTPSQDIELF